MYLMQSNCFYVFVFVFLLQADSPTHSTASTNDYCADLDEFMLTPPRDLHHMISSNNNNNIDEHGKSKDYLSIYSTYPLNGIHKHKKQHRSIFQSNHLLGRQSEHASKEEGFEGLGEVSDCDETASVHSDYSTPDKRFVCVSFRCSLCILHP